MESVNTTVQEQPGTLIGGVKTLDDITKEFVCKEPTWVDGSKGWDEDYSVEELGVAKYPRRKPDRCKTDAELGFTDNDVVDDSLLLDFDGYSNKMDLLDISTTPYPASPTGMCNTCANCSDNSYATGDYYWLEGCEQGGCDPVMCDFWDPVTPMMRVAMGALAASLIDEVCGPKIGALDEHGNNRCYTCPEGGTVYDEGGHNAYCGPPWETTEEE